MGSKKQAKRAQERPKWPKKSLKTTLVRWSSPFVAAMGAGANGDELLQVWGRGCGQRGGYNPYFDCSSK